MDQKKCEMSGMVMSSEESAFALQTPQKVGEPLSSRTEVADNSRYETIVELFDHMTCSLRLLDLCKKSPTFGNVSAQVEVLAKRKFIYSHLAQIKFILPEVIQIEKLLIYDKKTLCMRPDMKITVQLDAIEKCHEQSGFRALRELFMSRLVNYFTDHPEASVVPEAMLPGPFHQGYQISDIQDTLKDSVFQRQSTVTDGIILSEASGLPESFSRHFSQKVVLSEKTQLLASPITFSSSSFANPTNQELRGRKEGHSNGVHPEPITEINHSVCSKQEEEASFSFCRSAIIVPSVESPYPCSSVDPIAKESPAGKFSSASENLMIATPAQMTPKRSISGCDNNTKSMSNKQCWSCQKPAKRSLDFSSLKGDRSSMDRSETCKHVHDYSPCSLKLVKEKNLSGFAGLLHQLQENERGRLSEDQISTKQSLRMCQGLSYLNGIAATVNYVFQSVGCSSITREELVHKIIMNNCEVLERKEVEEQVELLGKLFPDWFYRRSTHSGDIMYSIREGTSLESIKSRLIGS